MRWYHTLELPGGVVTPGEFDHRRVVGRLPWPPLAGARCLDVGSRNGFYAFHMEAQGAREVVSLDVDDPADLQFPAGGPDPEAIAAEVRAGNEGFEHARGALGSSVQRVYRTVYDLDPEWIGSFDVAVVGTLLMHLRDPVGALQAVRRVTTGHLLVNEGVVPSLSMLRRRPVADLAMRHEPFWYLANAPALRRWVEAAGFEVVSVGRPYLLPWGPGRGREPLSLRPFSQLPRRLAMRRGGPHVWLLARPM
jgi:tRNA (mo5U34)-methyltransferase